MIVLQCTFVYMYMTKPATDEYAPFYQGYVDQIEEGDILEILSRQIDAASALLDSFNERGDHAYAPGKWTVKQLIQHVIDAERVFQYRILRITRGDKTALAGFDENDYAAAADVTSRSVEGLIGELVTVRSSTYALVLNISEAQAIQRGEASGAEVSVRALCYITAGHLEHHLRILRERYMQD